MSADQYEKSNGSSSKQEQFVLNNSNNNNSHSRKLSESAPATPNSFYLDQQKHNSINQQKDNNNNNNNNNNSQTYVLSEVEAAILRSTVPIDVNETEEITVNGEKGIWANKSEITNWRGILPLSQYVINDDPNPEIVRKRSDQKLLYQQEVAIRYLKPPTPPPPGEILIQQEVNVMEPPAPPLVIRQQPPRPVTPPPLIVREVPPQPPPIIGRKIITISGKKMPPPPRKVIIERLPPLPSKPQSVIIERWLPYRPIKRKVIFQRANENKSPAVVVKPRNIIIQWEAPSVTVKKEFKDLGIVRANPVEYIQRYGTSLKRSIELPTFVKEIKPPEGLILAADSSSPLMYELEGDLHALSLVDLEREGLIEYKGFLKQIGFTDSRINKISNEIFNNSNNSNNSNNNNINNINNNSNNNSNNNIEIKNDKNETNTEQQTVHFNTRQIQPALLQQQQQQQQQKPEQNQSISAASNSSATNSNIEFTNDLLRLLDLDSNNTISIGDAEKILSRLNSRLGRPYGDEQAKEFFSHISFTNSGRIDFEQFQNVLEQQL
jgi:hypothetical protein